MSADSSSSGPQPTAHEVEPGCSLDRRTFLGSSAATVGGAIAMSGTSSAQQVGGDGDGWLGCEGGEAVGEWDRSAQCVVLDYGHATVSNAASFFFGSDDDDDEFAEYLENELLRIHGDMYLSGVHEHGSTGTSLTWASDNADLLEGRAYIRALLDAYDVIDGGATRQESIDAAQGGVDDVFSVSLEEVIQEYHRSLANARRFLDRFRYLHDETDAEVNIDEIVDFGATLPGEDDVYFRSSHDDAAGFDWTGYDSEPTDLEYTLFNGETIEVPTIAVYYEGDADDLSGTAFYGGEGLYSLHGVGIDVQPVEETSHEFPMRGRLEDEERRENQEQLIAVQGFDVHEYNNVYGQNADGSKIDGEQVFLEAIRYFDAIEAIQDAHSTVSDNLEVFIDEAYDDIVNGDITREDIQTLESMVEQASDSDPYARVNTHLALLGRSTSHQHMLIEFGERDTESADYDPEVDDLVGRAVSGTLHLYPAPDNPLQIDETYTPEALGISVSLTTGMQTEDGTIEPGAMELEDDREFTVLEAKTVNDDGELVDAEELEFSDGAPTETPTDYDELHARLDEMERFQLEVLEKQLELVETMAEDDDEVEVTIPGIPSADDIVQGVTWLGLGLIGIVVLAVIGIVTDLIPGLGDN